MSDVVNRTTCEYLKSVNTPDYPVEDWIINPDLSALEEVPQKYWKIDGDNVLEMTQAEKDAVDEAIEAARIEDLKTQDIRDQGFDSGSELFELTLLSKKWVRHRQRVPFKFAFVTPPNVTISNTKFDGSADLRVVKVTKKYFGFVISARCKRRPTGLTTVSFNWEAIL